MKWHVGNGGSKREERYARLAKEVSISMHKQYCKHQATEIVKCIYRQCRCYMVSAITNCVVRGKKYLFIFVEEKNCAQ